MGEEREGVAGVEEGSDCLYKITIRSVVEQHHLISAKNPTEAELRFSKMRESGEVFVLGVVQATKTEKVEELDLEGFEVLHETEGPGCPVFYTVVHTVTGLRKTSSSIKYARDKVVADLSRRGQNVL